ncbi:hypothetical protein GWK47_027195 [Chionoecetes opilio]|uniref:Uncharacterized protein n=1 Tax=Chionoecetes opilio TaxID=41210 RepID=A0A8J8WCH1_CHIOP|nr:hypothetical protein GWK47_027195 [Chionoecetes opilio]
MSPPWLRICGPGFEFRPRQVGGQPTYLFIRLQVNADVRRTQVEAWCSLVTAWGKERGVSQIDVTEAANLAVFKVRHRRALPPNGSRWGWELVRRGNPMDRQKQTQGK